MRGPLHFHKHLTFHQRITPAYAGTTSSSVRPFSTSKDHPRLCGDHFPIKKSLSWVAGSPPLMRGPPAERSYSYCLERITPAYAGTTRSSSIARRANSDHPRLCGDHRRPGARGEGYTGSPPLMRGPPILPVSHVFVGGITPAYAGTTSSLLTFLRCSWDHPRLCGDHFRYNEA